MPLPRRIIMFARLMSLKTAIITFIIVLSVVVASFTGYLFLLKNNISETTELYVNEMNEQNMFNVNSKINQIYSSLELLGKSFDLENELDGEKILASISSQPSQEHLVSYFYFDRHGGAASTINPAFNVASRDYFQTVLSGKRAVKNISDSKMTDAETISFIVPLYSKDGRVIGGLGAAYNTDVLSALVDRSGTDGNGYTFITQENGEIIQHPDKNYIGKNIFTYLAQNKIVSLGNVDEVKSLVSKTQSGVVEYKNNVKSFFAGYSKSTLHDWIVVTSVSTDMMMSQYNYIVRLTLYLTSIIFVLLVVMTIVIIYQIRNAMGQVSQNSKRLNAFISNVPGGVFKVSLATEIMSDFNPGMFKIFGATQDEFEMHYGFRFSSIVEDSEKYDILQKLREEKDICEMEFHTRRIDGELRLLYYRGSTVIENGRPVQYAIITDITDIRQTNNALREYQSSLSVLTDTIPGGVATFIQDTNFTLMNINDGFFTLCGYTREEFEGKFDNRLRRIMNDNDFMSVRRTLTNQVKVQGFIEVQFPIRHKNGSELWLLMRGSPTKNENGCYAYQVVILDISAQRRAMEDLEKERERYRIMAAITADILFEYDVKNKKFTSFIVNNGNANLSLDNSEVLPCLKSKKFIHKEDGEIIDKLIGFLEVGKDSFYEELRTDFNYDDYIWVAVDGKTVFSQSGKPLRVVGRVTNINEKKKSTENLIFTAQRDLLTGLYNKIITQNEVEKFIHSDEAQGISALMIIDMDNFKGVNDNFGHLFGDTVLKSVTSKMKKVFRSQDIVGRVGGDEFVVFMKNVNSVEMVKTKAEQVADAFRNTYTSGDVTCDISSSIGITIFPEAGKTYEELFEKADKALYKAKIEGKNRFYIYHPEEDYTRDASSLKRVDTSTGDGLFASVDNMLLSDMVSTLYGSSDFKTSISSALELMNQNFGATYTFIMEKTGGTNFCCFHGFPSDMCKNGMETQSIDTNRYLKLFNNEGMLYCSDLEIIKEQCPSIYNRYKNMGIKLLLQTKINNNDELFGFVTIASTSESVIWNNELCTSFVVLSKIIGAYLINIRLDESIEKRFEKDSSASSSSLNRFLLDTSGFSQSIHERYAIMYVDIEDFKRINNVYGFVEGDRILSALEKAIAAAINTNEKYARVGVDSFILLIKYEGKEKTILRFNELNTAFNRIEMPQGGFYSLIVKAGVCQIQPGDNDLTAVIDKANKARITAKGTKKSTCIIYNKEHRRLMEIEQELEGNLMSALEDGEFFANYKLKRRISDNEIVGAEALARWKHNGETYYPSDFIPLFEQKGLVSELDFHILAEVCASIKRAISSNEPYLPVSVHFSQLTLLRRDFRERLITLIESYGLCRGCVEIEVQERAIIDQGNEIISVISKLRESGFLVCIDNYGSSSSVISLFDTFSADVIKISDTYINSAINDERKTRIISDMIRFAQNYGITIIADQTDTAELSDYAKSIGCDLIQGYPAETPLSEMQFRDVIMNKK